mmetsp:Transcript_4111/g.4642  ORF Transcript_4111/g.4642 Transcript_4111/m.4642 type:complete len:139 (+) Transcript_4111:124-540(+)
MTRKFGNTPQSKTGPKTTNTTTTTRTTTATLLPTQSQDQKHQKRKERTSKRKNSGERNDPAKVKRRLAKLAKKKQHENWKKAKKNHNVIQYMHNTNLATNQSNEIDAALFWCYFNPHKNTPRMSNERQTRKTEKGQHQ